MPEFLKCSIMHCDPAMSENHWEHTDNVMGSLEHCKARLNSYRERDAKHGLRYILVEELSTAPVYTPTTQTKNLPKIIVDWNC
jgi:hypothetical protein